MTDKPIVLFDMDGTLCNYEATMLEALNMMRKPGEPFMHALPGHPPQWLEIRMGLIKRQPGFWFGLPRIEDGFEILELVREHTDQIHILTKGPFNTTSAWTEKVEWCRQHVPDAKVTITEDKGLVYGRMLVDDWPPYVEAWLAHRPRGLVVMPDRHHNADFRHPQVVRWKRTEDDPSCYSARKAISVFLRALVLRGES